MTSKHLEGIYETFDCIFGGKAVFALGGYYSLIRQGILPEYREINDLDINVLASSEGDRWSIKNSVFCALRDVASSYNNTSCTSGIMRIDKVDIKSYAHKEYDDLPFCDPIESNSSFSIELSIGSPVKLKTSAPDPKARSYDSPILTGPGITEQIRSGTATYYNTTIGNSLTFSAPLSSGYSYSQWIEENPMVRCTKTTVEDEMKREGMMRISKLILSLPNRTLKMDFFLLDTKNLHGKVFFDGSELLTKYYPVLSAKHKYCMDPKTNNPSFEKHMRDLGLSYSAKSIKGINYPEDLDLLFALRRERNTLPNVESK